MNDQRLAALIGEWLTARGLHRSAEVLKAEASALPAAAPARSPPTELDCSFSLTSRREICADPSRAALLSKLSKGDTYYKPPPNIFVKRTRPRPRAPPHTVLSPAARNQAPVPDGSAPGGEGRVAGRRRCRLQKDLWPRRGACLCASAPPTRAPLIRPPVQQDVAAAVPTPAAHPAAPAHDAPKEAHAASADHAGAAAVHGNAEPVAAAAAAAAPGPVAVQHEDESIPKHYVEANLPPTPDGSATVNPAAVVDEDPFERFDLKVHPRHKFSCDQLGPSPLRRAFATFSTVSHLCLL